MSGGYAGRYLSFLDLMCCGLAGAILMVLLVVTSEPAPAETKRLVVIRARHLEGSRAEIGIEYLPPGQTEWIRPKPGGMAGVEHRFFASSSRPGTGSEAILVLRHPASGTWRFRTFRVDFTAPPGLDIPPGVPAGHEVPLRIQLDACGGQTTILRRVDRLMRYPGDNGPELDLAIGVRPPE